MTKEEFGKLIKSLREDTDFSLRKFAKEIGLSPTYMSRIENGNFDPPSHEKIKKMAEVLDYPADKLLSLANKIDKDLEEIIKKEPDVIPSFLRMATVEDMKEFLEKQKNQSLVGFFHF